MSLKHLSVGSEKPPKVKGKLRLYTMKVCPYAQRCHLVLLAKKIPYDVVHIDLANKPEWYLQLNPSGKVPSLETDSGIILESLAICNYLEENYPEVSLYSKDPEEKKHEIELIDNVMEPLIKVIYRCLVNLEQQTAEQWAKEIQPFLEQFEAELVKKGTTFLGGEKPGMVDYIIWPFRERAPLIAILLGQKLFKPDQFPNFGKWHAAMVEDPLCIKTAIPLETHKKVLEKKLKKLPVNFDEI